MEMGEPGTVGCGDRPPLLQELTAPGGTARRTKGTGGTSRNGEGRAGLQAGGQNWTGHSASLALGLGWKYPQGLRGWAGVSVEGSVQAQPGQGRSRQHVGNRMQVCDSRCVSDPADQCIVFRKHALFGE